MKTNRRGFLTGAGALVASAACGRVETVAKGPGKFSITALNPDCMVGGAVLRDHIDRGGIRKTYCTNVHGDVTVETDGKDLHVTCDPEKLYVHDPK